MGTESQSQWTLLSAPLEHTALSLPYMLPLLCLLPCSRIRYVHLL